MKIIQYGPGKKLVRFMTWLSWPIIILAKRLSSYPVVKHIINPFFAYPWNEVTVIPINQEVGPPDSVVLPRQVVEKLVSTVNDIFILDECICRNIVDCNAYPKNIGCMALGKAISRMHPSHGHKATAQEAIEHVQKAAQAGLVANIAHTWIDPFAFGLTQFNRLMFICFCDDCCCMYRTHMKKRGINLNHSYKGLPGISIDVNAKICDGCGVCADQCFVAAMKIQNGIASPDENCRACGRCIDACPQGAVSLHMNSEHAVYEQLVNRIKAVVDIWG